MVYNNYMKRSRTVSLFVLSSVIFLWCISGIAGISGSGNIPADAKGPAHEISKDNLKSTIEILEQYGERSSSQKQSEAIAWARGQFEKLGIPCWVETYESNGKTWPNLFARIEGKKDPSALLMVIAHIDSRSSDPGRGAPGADDNGTGVAVLLEIARILRQYSPGDSIQFCLFTNEERGSKGSKAFARMARAHGQNIKAVINLDTLGYNRPFKSFDWDALRVRGSWKGKKQALSQMVKNLRLPMPWEKDMLIVGGRPANGKLVKVVGDRLRESSGILVKEIVHDGVC
jgi:hypothetical protein